MSLSDQAIRPDAENLGVSAQEFLSYSKSERERRLNSGEPFNQEAFDKAVDRVIRKLRMLAEEGWS